MEQDRKKIKKEKKRLKAIRELKEQRNKRKWESDIKFKSGRDSRS